MRKELGIYNFEDLLHHFPYRHVDKTKFDAIGSLKQGQEFAFVKGKLISLETAGYGRSMRLTGKLRDASGTMDLVWFRSVSVLQKMLSVGKEYRMFGRLGFYLGMPQFAHPETESDKPDQLLNPATLLPIYPVTENLKARGISASLISSFAEDLFRKVAAKDLPENLPEELLTQFKLIGRYDAYRSMHFPANPAAFQQALRRLKFEELFLAQIRLNLMKLERHRFSKGNMFENVGDIFNGFYNNNLPFALTTAQKKVFKEIRRDCGSGKQMNRLLQGDVGSGKTVVALMAILLAADNGYQSVLMAPTEILAAQHFESITELTAGLNITVGFLTGSVKGAERKKIIIAAVSGELQVLIGTHAVIEEKVTFANLGLAVIDEQHKFGVAQRAKLAAKNEIQPHVLVMTATPIPRTLALTAYGDLDYSVIDELPPGRKPIITSHRYENKRPEMMKFIKEQVAEGRQAYIIYPLIEESSKLDYENLMKGYEEVKSFFPEPKYAISMVHGKMDAEQKETNMRRFKNHHTQIMVSTTVIEVGVNVPNASVMMIESAEKFGLSQLHQLRGRVGRGADQSFCILLSAQQLSKDAVERLRIMTATNDGFKIAEKDLELRGPGEIEGTRQSGALNFRLADPVADRAVLEAAKVAAEAVLSSDPQLSKPENARIKAFLHAQRGKTGWSKVA